MSSIHTEPYRGLHSKGRKPSLDYADREYHWTEYNGRWVKLCAAPLGERSWTCEYTIVEFWSTRSFSESGYAVDSYPTRNEAEAAALAIAQGVIDSRDPVSDLSRVVGHV